MLFQQTSAPSGWTKDTSLNNRALRLVSGSVSNGGGNAFTTVFNSTVTTGGGSVQGHILSQSEIPSHYHLAFRSGNHGQLRNGTNMSSNNYPGSGSGAGNLYESYNISASGSVSNVGRTSSRGADLSYNLEVSLEEAVYGKSLNIEIPSKERKRISGLKKVREFVDGFKLLKYMIFFFFKYVFFKKFFN